MTTTNRIVQVLQWSETREQPGSFFAVKMHKVPEYEAAFLAWGLGADRGVTVSWAIVEKADGSVVLVHPEMIRFVGTKTESTP